MDFVIILERKTISAFASFVYNSFHLECQNSNGHLDLCPIR